MVDVAAIAIQKVAGRIHVILFMIWRDKFGVNKLGKRRTYNQKRTTEKSVFKEFSNIYFIYSHSLHHKKHVKMTII